MGETRPREGASTLLKVKETYGLRGGGAQEERSREASANGMWPIRTQSWPVWTKIWPIRTRRIRRQAVSFPKNHPVVG